MEKIKKNKKEESKGKKKERKNNNKTKKDNNKMGKNKKDKRRRNNIKGGGLDINYTKIKHRENTREHTTNKKRHDVQGGNKSQ